MKAVNKARNKTMYRNVPNGSPSEKLQRKNQWENEDDEEEGSIATQRISTQSTSIANVKEILMLSVAGKATDHEIEQNDALGCQDLF